VTAEFMLLFPAVVLALAGILGVFQLGLTQLQLSREAFSQARSLSIGGELVNRSDILFTVSHRERLVCVSATKNLVFKLEAEACLFKHGL
jgi:hypothetical protein